MVFSVKEKKYLANGMVQRRSLVFHLRRWSFSQEQGSPAGREAGRGAGPLSIREDPSGEGEKTPGPKYSY